MKEEKGRGEGVEGRCEVGEKERKGERELQRVRGEERYKEEQRNSISTKVSEQ